MKQNLYLCAFKNLKNMLVIGIAGGSGSGKTTVVKELVRQLPENSVSVISQDAYYFDNGDKTPEEKKQQNQYFFWYKHDNGTNKRN